MKHQIFSRYNSAKVLYECELPDDTPSGLAVSHALEKAVSVGANLSYADLSYADLSYADLSGAYLPYADLSYVDLFCANLFCANLYGADLSYANLSYADLSGAKNDFWEILIRAPREVAGLRAALVGGKVDGSTYQGSCACLVGSIANIRGVGYHALGNGITPNSSRPAERWFLAIKRGDTPDTNQISNLTVAWLDEFVSLQAAYAEAV